MTLIRAETLLLVLRGELDEQRFVHKLRQSDPKVDDTEVARLAGFIEALEFAVAQVEARAKKAAA